MEHIERTVTIGAPAEAIFRYLNEPRKLINLVPGARQIDILEHKPHGGWLFEWQCILCGVQFEGRGECAVYIPHQLMSYILSGGLNVEITWRIKPVVNGSQVIMRIEYDLPTPLQRRHPLAEVTECYAAEAERILDTLAAALSEHTPA